MTMVQPVLEDVVDIPLQDGHAAAHFFRPAAGAHPAVLHLTDIFGPREETRRMAKSLAAEGFCVLQPHCFYRAGQAPLISPIPPVTDDATLQKIKALFPYLTPAHMEADIPFYLSCLEKQAGVRAGAMGAVGYCFTGQMALRAAAGAPEKIGAAASFHGGGLYTQEQDSPHLRLKHVSRAHAALYFGHAENDKGMTADDIKNFETALSAWGGRYESETYAGAVHGWTVEGRKAYNAPLSLRAHEKLVAFLKDALAA